MWTGVFFIASTIVSQPCGTEDQLFNVGGTVSKNTVARIRSVGVITQTPYKIQVQFVWALDFLAFCLLSMYFCHLLGITSISKTIQIPAINRIDAAHIIAKHNLQDTINISIILPISP